MDIRISPDLDALSRAAMDETMGAVREAVAQRGRFAIALAGGHTPARMYALWASEPYRSQTPWDRVHLFWGDERYVAHDDSLSNFRMARETLISHVPIAPSNVHPIPVSATPQKSAETYEQELGNFFGSAAPELDLQLLGIGTEGHTASLFPGSAALEEKQRWVLSVEVAATPPRRLTLTPVVLNRGRRTLFLAVGKDKAEIVSALRNERNPQTSKYPAARIRPAGSVLWLLDQAAAG
ncbi:MAG TPA: 6-phosphogluconolactonase [Candidatus Acidoferrum sp.]|nr:6-phosphogluconolactonase [Candidatus Acidoferrum sp.]